MGNVKKNEKKKVNGVDGKGRERRKIE